MNNAVVLAGGLGTRIVDTFPDTPKVLIEVGGRPILDIQLEMLWQIGVTKSTVVTAHMHNAVEAHLTRLESPMDVRIVKEDTPTGTLRALEAGLSGLSPEWEVLWLNGDTLIPKSSWGILAEVVATNPKEKIIALGSTSPPLDYSDSFQLSNNAIVGRRRLSADEATNARTPQYFSSGLFFSKVGSLQNWIQQTEGSSNGSIEAGLIELAIRDKRAHLHPKSIEFFDIGTPLGHARAENFFGGETN